MAEQSTPGGMPDFMRLLAEMKLPGLPDMEALSKSNRRNIEALTAANRVALEGAQNIARRQMEIMQQSMSEMTEGMKLLGTSETPQAKAARQAELLKQGYERAVGIMRELSETIQRSNTEALNLLNRRFSEAMDELRALAHHKDTPTA